MQNNNNGSLSPQSDDKLVTVTTAGDSVKVTELAYRNTVPRCRKMNKDCCCDDDGIVHDYKHIENRSQDLKSVRRSLNKLVDIINANVSDSNLSHCRWVTLTYAENMTNHKRLMDDWGKFCKKARRKWGKFEYIAIKEPQARGAWHLHVIMIFESEAPFIDNAVLAKKWGNGFVNVRKLTSGVNLGLYFAASLRDMTKSEAEIAGIDTAGRKTSSDKKYIKGARLELYPRDIDIFTHSQDINKPQKETMTKSQADQLVKDMIKVDEFDTDITDGEGRRINHLTITRYEEKPVKRPDDGFQEKSGGG